MKSDIYNNNNSNNDKGIQRFQKDNCNFLRVADPNLDSGICFVRKELKEN